VPSILRKTRQKDAIREAFVLLDRPLSPEEVLEEAGRHVDSVSIATVYRNVTALLEEKWLVPVELPGHPARYEVAGKDHHHHFQCRTCLRVYEVPGCEIHAKPKLPRGFKTSGHDLLLYGTCALCGSPEAH
jgi:Fur family ferric uptake transcriptional regulator